MKTKIKIFAVIILVMASCTKIIVNNVSSFSECKSKNHLLCYYLPKRQIEIKFAVKHQMIKPSPFFKDSSALDSDIERATGKKMVKKEMHKLVLEGLEVNAVSVADPNKLFSVDYRKCPFSKIEGNVSISENGLIQTGTYSIESKAYQIIQTGIESLAGIVGNIVGLKRGIVRKELTEEEEKSINIKIAKELLDKLADIQNDKAALITSTDDMDPELFEIKLSMLKELEKGLVEQLTGEVFEEEYTISKTWEPDIKEVHNGHIDKTFNIEMEVGIKAMLNIPVIFTADIDNQIYNQLNFTGDSGKIVYANDKNNNTGFYYNIPVPIKIKVYKNKVSEFNQLNFVVNSNKQSSITLGIPQFGTVSFLPARLTKSEIKFYSDLGSIKEYSFTRDVSINPSEAKNISSSIDTVFSTIKYLKGLDNSVIDEKTIDSNKSELHNAKITITTDSK